MDTQQIEKLKRGLESASMPESAKAAIRKKLQELEGAEKGVEESATKQEEKLEKEEDSKQAEVDDKLEKLKKSLSSPSMPESAKAAIRKRIEDAEKLKTEAKKERAEEKKEAQEKKKEVKAKVEKAVKEVEKVVKEAPKKIQKAPATEKKAVEKRVEKEVKQKVEKAKTEAKKAEVEAKKADAKKSEGAKKRKKKFDKMLSDLQRFINKDKKLKALYGSDSKEDLKRDAGRMAKPFGWRYKGEHNYKVPPKSERGNDNTYYEGRPEKADLRRRTYPYLEMGGDVMAKGGMTEGQSILLKSIPNPTYERFYNKEVVIEELKGNKITKAFVRSTGEKVPFVIDLNTFKVEKYADGGMMAKGGYVVFNYTDNIHASNEVFKTKKEAKEFIENFRNRFIQQGYYRTNYGERIPTNQIDLEVIPEDFNPFKKMADGGMMDFSDFKTFRPDTASQYTVVVQFLKENNQFDFTTNTYTDYKAASKAYDSVLNNKNLLIAYLIGQDYKDNIDESYKSEKKFINYPKSVILKNSSDEDYGLLSKSGEVPLGQIMRGEKKFSEFADGGEISNIKMYYHKTSGGAEYLCSEKVAGTNEGSMKAKFVCRIDGAKNGSEMTMKPMGHKIDYLKSVKTIKMYYHKTSGGAEYLCSEKVSGTNEGSMRAKYVVRIDGAKNGSEMITKYADGGMMADGGDTRGEFGTFLIEIFENGVLRKEKIVRGGYKNLVEEMAKEEAKSYKKPVVNVRKIMSDTTHVAFNLMDKNEYSVVGWMSEEDRDMGESEGLGMYDSLEEAKRKADVAFYRQGYAAVEVLRLSQQGDEDDEVVYFVEEEEEEFAKGGLFGNSRYNTGRSWKLDRARHNKKEDYEIPMENRKGASKSAPAKSGAKRAKTGKYAKSSRAASSSSSSRGYDYIPNAKIKSITTTDGKVITSKKVLDGAYVRKKNGGMM